MPTLADYQNSSLAKDFEAYKAKIREHCATLDLENLHALAEYYHKYAHTCLLMLEDKIKQRLAWDPVRKLAESPEFKRGIRNVLIEDHVTAYNNIELLRLVIDHIRKNHTIPDDYVVSMCGSYNDMAQRGKNAQDTIKVMVASFYDLHVAHVTM